MRYPDNSAEEAQVDMVCNHDNSVTNKYIDPIKQTVDTSWRHIGRHPRKFSLNAMHAMPLFLTAYVVIQ
jgi:hypothetical protein